jgi:hypothetical protein
MSVEERETRERARAFGGQRRIGTLFGPIGTI